jgi:hypothetical protein
MTLIEIALALLVLAFGLGAVVHLHLASQRAAALAHRRVAAQTLAARKGQEIKAVGYRDLLAYLSRHEREGEGHLALCPPEAPAELILEGVGRKSAALKCSWQAEIEQPADMSGCLRILSRVEWGGGTPEQCRGQQIVYVFE